MYKTICLEFIRKNNWQFGVSLISAETDPRKRCINLWANLNLIQLYSVLTGFGFKSVPPDKPALKLHEIICASTAPIKTTSPTSTDLVVSTWWTRSAGFEWKQAHLLPGRIQSTSLRHRSRLLQTPAYRRKGDAKFSYQCGTNDNTNWIVTDIALLCIQVPSCTSK